MTDGAQQKDLVFCISPSILVNTLVRKRLDSNANVVPFPGIDLFARVRILSFKFSVEMQTVA